MQHGSGLGQWRWVVERTFAWLNQFRRLRVRYERRADIHEAFLSLGCVLICWRARMNPTEMFSLPGSEKRLDQINMRTWRLSPSSHRRGKQRPDGPRSVGVAQS